MTISCQSRSGGPILGETTNQKKAGGTAKPSADDRLKQVKELYDQGLIDKETYDKKLKEIIGSL